MPAAVGQHSGGIDEVITFVVTRPDDCRDLIKSGAPDEEIFSTGHFVRLKTAEPRTVDLKRVSG